MLYGIKLNLKEKEKNKILIDKNKNNLLVSSI